MAGVGSGRIHELDGVRAIAVALVFLNHFAPIHSVPRLQIVSEAGWVGVDLFFVMSGLLITGILVDSRERADYYRTFYLRRSLRIFPLYYLVLVAILCATYPAITESWGSPIWFFAYAGNLKTAITGVSPPSPMVPMWSLHLEEQFYLLFPFLVHRLRRRTLHRVLIALVVAAPLLRLGLWLLAPERRLLQYMLLPCRMDGLAWGALIALQLRAGPFTFGRRGLALVATAISAAACALFVAAGRTFDSAPERVAGYSLFAAAAAAWILWIVRFPGSAATAWLNARPLRFLGKISYGLYLLQAPLGATLEAALPALRARPDWLHTARGSSALAALCVALASLSWYALERPLLRLKDQLAPSPERRRAPA